MSFLEKKVAIVTGAGKGIGFAIACSLASRGAALLINDIDADCAEAAANAIRETGGMCIAYPGDAGEVVCIEHMVERTLDAYGTVDIAIANAGVTLFGDLFSYTQEAFQHTVTVNLQGSFFLAQAAARQMRKQQSGGKILFMSSVLAVQAHTDLAPYCMTKAAIGMLARTLALELAPHRITINALAPGATRTERTLQDDLAYVERWTQITPSGKVAEPQDIARSALFLLSPDADHITGQTLVIDGGWSQTAYMPEMV